MKNTNQTPGGNAGRNKRKVELLAPAGGMNQLVAAVENGADAVYLGGRFFNARMNAENFTEEELKSAIDYAHLRNVKTYVTMNVLIKDEELADALNHAAELYRMGADGLIVQDLGLADAVRKTLPQLPLHLSTQGTVYNSSGVRTAVRLGFKRVVLARELAISDIKEITKDTDCEIEVFVHGALCICYSGQCQLSRVIGGRSANRGECAQPCRLPYRDEAGNEGYFLSPKDLCAVDLLGDLVEAGATSIKIEGRMKSPEYVGTVVRIYRKYLDLALRGKSYQVDPKDEEDLLQVFNRGGFSKGYLTGQPGQSLLSGRIPKHQGVLVGKVLQRPKEKDLVDISFSKQLTIGDGIEIHGREINSNILTYYRDLGKKIARIGDFKGDVRKGDLVYRTSSKILSGEIKTTFSRGIGQSSRTIPVTMRFQAFVGQPATLVLTEGADTVLATSPDVCQTAHTKPLDRETVRRQLEKTGGTPFFPAGIDIQIGENVAMPLSTLNLMRRDATEKLTAVKTADRAHGPVTMPAYPLLADALAKDLPDDLLVLPPVTKGKEDQWLAQHQSKTDVMVNNLGWIEKIQQNGKKVFAGPGLNIYNGAAAQALTDIGVVPAAPSYEMAQCGMPLMTTEFPIQAKQLTDRKGKKYTVRKNSWGDKWVITVCEPADED